MDVSFLQNSVRVGVEVGRNAEISSDLERFQIDHHQANFDCFHLVRDDFKRPW
jgi:hypothetical protein